jgi:tetratricopeptide (TPR) repeat protein
MVLDELSAAEAALREAWTLAPHCRLAETPEASPCVFYLHRRQGILDLASDRHPSALAEIERSLEGFRGWGRRPSHDLNGDGEASSLHARAEARFHLKDYEGSIADFTVCLERFPASSAIWSTAYRNLAYALSRTSHEGRKKAHAMLEHRRLAMRSRENTVEGGYFLWVDGQLAYALKIRRDRAMKRMKRALAFFASEGMPDEFRGVSLDIARAYYPRRDLIVDFLNETESARERLIRSERQKRMFAEIYELSDGSPQPDTLTLLDTVLRRFRDALVREASVPPCLLTAT